MNEKQIPKCLRQLLNARQELQVVHQAWLCASSGFFLSDIDLLEAVSLCLVQEGKEEHDQGESKEQKREREVIAQQGGNHSK